jgi:hypothetical protein
VEVGLRIRGKTARLWLGGNSIEKLAATLGHYSVVMTGHYAHLRPISSMNLATDGHGRRKSKKKVGAVL